MEKRALVAAALSVGILILWQVLFPPPKQSVPVAPEESIPVQAAQQPLATAPTGTPETVTADAEESGAEPGRGVPENVVDGERLSDAVSSRTIRIDTSLYSATILTRGATIGEWFLKDYPDGDGKPVNLLSPTEGVPPLAVRFPGPDPTWADRAVFQTDAPDRIVVDETTGTASVTLRASAPGGGVLVKTLTFHPGLYRVDVKVETPGTGLFRLAVGSDFGIFNQPGASSRVSGHVGPLYSTDTDREEIKPQKISGEKVINETIRWIGQEEGYFAAVIAPVKAELDGAVVSRVSETRADIAFQVKSASGEFLLYAGPKEYDRLKALGARMEYVIDFGFFSIIAIPLFWFMRLLYGLVHNYGITIILISILIKVPFIPLMNKSQASMKKMQEIQPRLKEIQEKYKKDPDRLRKETMEIYRSNKVSPLGGCLPMVLQIPVFFALYKVLLISIELRGAPFVGWITDLSAKDPYYILPVLMGATMFLQQKLTPSSMDPKQAKIMLFMPLIFSFMFMSLPSGLVLYWTVTNVFSILQQLYVNRKNAAKAVVAT